MKFASQISPLLNSKGYNCNFEQCKHRTILSITKFYFVFRGMTVTSGSVKIQKDDTNLIGISIGGGAPLCPCLYIVQVKKLFVKHLGSILCLI